MAFDIYRELDALLALGRMTRDDAGGRVRFAGEDPLVESVFRLGAIAGVGRMLTAVAAGAIWKERSGRGQDLDCDLAHVIHELAPDVRLNGYTPEQLQSVWARNSGYQANFVRTKDGRLVTYANPYPPLIASMTDTIGIPSHRKKEILEAIQGWNALELEKAASDAGACCVMVRTYDEWLAEEQCRVLADLPVIQIERLGDSRPEPLSRNPKRPLSGIRALGLARILAGATVGTVFSEHGADVLNIWSPEAFETNNAYIFAHMGMRPAWVPERTSEGRSRLHALVKDADVFFENRREGAMDRRGLSFEELARVRPGIVYVSLRAYGHQGPWKHRVGFDTPVTCATGAAALEGTLDAPRRPPKAPVNDWLAGWFGAFGALAALRLRAKEGGSWRVRVSLARTNHWWLQWPRFDKPVRPAKPLGDIEYYQAQTPLGEYQGIPCQLRFSSTQPYFETPLRVLGSGKPEWRPL
jgi:crotonobetainyl-CoA:carnitine CoA-transferase CaiB-like acyl-CoA transferase